MKNIFIWLTLCVSLVNGVTVTTGFGEVIGQTFTLNTGVKINYFYSIPYAKPPIGPLRFKDPVAPAPWTTPFLAKVPGPVCPQPNIVLGLTNPTWRAFDEDCLHLNIFAPNDASKRLYPVMFWIHGGSFQFGGSISYPGHSLAGKGVVVVVINYRLGHLGFMSTNDDAATGNYGLKDQILALKFVRDNIEPFGGDPTKVTIFGESAGASSVGLLSIIPEAKGLFHKTILQSGTDLNNWAVNVIEQHQEKDTQNVAEKLDCPTNNTQEMMNCLRSKDWRNIINIPTKYCGLGYVCLGFAPVVDGTFLPDHPHYLREGGMFDPLPTLIGSNTEDGSFETAIKHPEVYTGTFTKDKFISVLKKYVKSYSSRLMGQDDKVYKTLTTMFPPSENNDANIKTLNDFYTDTSFAVYNHVLLKRLKAKGSGVFHYIYGYRSSKSLLPAWMGTTHASEIDFVFGMPQHQNDSISNDLKITNPQTYTQDDHLYAEFIMTLWTNFAKYGNPTPSKITTPLDKKSIVWNKINEQNNSESSYLFLGREVENKINYREDYMKFWTHCFRCLAPNMFEIKSTSAGTVPPVTPPSDCDCPEEKPISAARNLKASQIIFVFIIATILSFCICL